MNPEVRSDSCWSRAMSRIVEAMRRESLRAGLAIININTRADLQKRL